MDTPVYYIFIYLCKYNIQIIYLHIYMYIIRPSTILQSDFKLINLNRVQAMEPRNSTEFQFGEGAVPPFMRQPCITLLDKHLSLLVTSIRSISTAVAFWGSCSHASKNYAVSQLAGGHHLTPISKDIDWIPMWRFPLLIHFWLSNCDLPGSGDPLAPTRGPNCDDHHCSIGILPQAWATSTTSMTCHS